MLRPQRVRHHALDRLTYRPGPRLPSSGSPRSLRNRAYWRLRMRCSRCQQENPAGVKFCGGCGTPFQRLEGSAQPAPSYADVRRSLTDALEQQKATSAILRVISSSPTGIRPVFEAIATVATTLCEADFTGLFRFDGNLIHFEAHHGWSPEEIAASQSAFPQRPGRASVTARAILGAAIAHVADVSEDPDMIGALRTFRTVLSVPMILAGRPVGAITVARRAVRPFSDQQIALLQTFADQAVIAIENVRLINETKEALERQTATAEILRAISESPTDAQPVLEVIARNSVRVCGAAGCAVLILGDDDLIRLGATDIRSADWLKEMQRIFPAPIGADLATASAIREGRILHYPDVANNPDASPGISRTMEALGYGTWLGVPMMESSSGRGVIAVARADSAPFSERQIELLRTFADQAVIALQNVRLFTELQEKNRALTQAHAQVTEALEQQTATAEILRVISSSPTDVQPVFDTIVQSAARLCHAANAGVFLTDGQTLDLPANYGSASPEALATIRAQYPRPVDQETTAGVAILTRSVIHVPDIEAPSAAEVYTRRVGRLLGVRSMVAVPMIRKGEVVGAINLSRQEPGRFSDMEVELLKTFADQAVIAIENVRLFTELQTEQPRADDGAGDAERHQRHPARHQPLADGRPAGVRRDPGQRRPLAGGVLGLADPERGRSDRARRAHEHRRRWRRCRKGTLPTGAPIRGSAGPDPSRSSAAQYRRRTNRSPLARSHPRLRSCPWLAKRGYGADAPSRRGGRDDLGDSPRPRRVH